MGAKRSDGRHRRSERSRDAVIDALLGLYEDGIVRPRAAEVAERAGVSERSVFRHFDDLEAVSAAAIEKHWARCAHLFAAPPAVGTVHDRITALVEQRLRLHDRVAPVARAGAVVAATSPTVALALERRRLLLRQQVRDHFAVDLAAADLDRRSRPPILNALDAALCLEQVEYLRVSAGLSRPATRAALTRAATALLADASTHTDQRAVGP